MVLSESFFFSLNIIEKSYQSVYKLVFKMNIRPLSEKENRRHKEHQINMGRQAKFLTI